MKTRLLNLLPRNCRFEISMPQHTKPEKRQRNTLGKEDFANGCRDFGKSIANAADHKILKGSGVLIESRFLFFCGEEAFDDELVGEFDYWRNMLVVFGIWWDADIRKKGNALTTQVIVSTGPTLRSN
jgi:hypothetical protein